MATKKNVDVSDIDEFFSEPPAPPKKVEKKHTQKRVNQLTSKPVKKLTSLPPTRTVKGFKLTQRTRIIVELLAKYEGRKEYEILEEAIEDILKKRGKKYNLEQQVENVVKRR